MLDTHALDSHHIDEVVSRRLEAQRSDAGDEVTHADVATPLFVEGLEDVHYLCIHIIAVHVYACITMSRIPICESD